MMSRVLENRKMGRVADYGILREHDTCFKSDLRIGFTGRFFVFNGELVA